MLSQITSTSSIVNLCSLENLNIDMWKAQNKKHLECLRTQDIKSILELPSYVSFVKSYEVKLGKSRKEFNHLEKELVERKYYEYTNQDYK